MADSEKKDLEELHAAAVRSAAYTLGQAVAAAYHAGLSVKMTVEQLQEVGRRDPFPILDIEVSRPL